MYQTPARGKYKAVLATPPFCSVVTCIAFGVVRISSRPAVTGHLLFMLVRNGGKSFVPVAPDLAPGQGDDRLFAIVALRTMMVDMRRYLLVLDTDLLALDEKLNLEPINHLVEQQEQEPCEVVVLSLVDTAQAKQRRMEVLLWGGASNILPAPAQFPTAARPGHDVNAAAEHRMNLTVRHLTTIGCQASGVISDEDLVQAVDAETRSHHYDEVILTISGQDAGWLARTLHRDPIHHLQRRWGAKLKVFNTGPGGTSAGSQGAGSNR